MSNTPTLAASLAHNLPAFLRECDGRLELVMHCTWVQDRYVCPRKFWLRYGEKVESTGPRPALNYGGAVHAALAEHYGNPGLGFPMLTARQDQLLQFWFDENPQPSDEYRNCGRAQALLQAYNEWITSGGTKGEAGGGWAASASGLEDFQVLAVEENFEVLVGEIVNPAVGSESASQGWVQATVPVYLAGRKDLVLAWNDGLWVMDHKTCSDWGSGDSNSHLDEGRRSFQFKGYAWAERARAIVTREQGGPTSEIARATLPILGTIGNYLVSRKPYVRPPAPGKAATPRNQFHREPFPFNSETLGEWREECLDVAGDILHDWQRGRWKAQDTGCGHWGRCEFYDYCEASPSDRPALLASSLFKEKVFERDL